MIKYEHLDPKLSYTQRKQNYKNLRNTIKEHLARYAGDPWTAYRLLQNLQVEALDNNLDLEYSGELLERNPQKKKEYQERYDAVASILSEDSVECNITFYVLKDIQSDLIYEQLNLKGENIAIDS